MNYTIEEQLVNSIFRLEDGTPVNEVLFTVVKTNRNKNYLYIGSPPQNEYDFFTTSIAECINGDYKERFGGIKGWLKDIKRLENKRIHKIKETILNLNLELSQRASLISKINEIGIK